MRDRLYKLLIYLDKGSLEVGPYCLSDAHKFAEQWTTIGGWDGEIRYPVHRVQWVLLKLEQQP